MDKVDFNYIRDFIIRGNVKKALEELLSVLQSSSTRQSQLRDDVIMMRSQFHEVERKESLHLLSSEEASRERAQLQKGILDVINSLENPQQAIPVRATSSETDSRIQLPSWVFMVGFALVILGFIFIPKYCTDPVVPPTDGEPDLVLSDWQFSPNRVVEESPIQVKLTVRNRGDVTADNFKVEWWAGVNFPLAEKTWYLSLEPGESQQLRYTYPGYISWYNSLETKVVLDADGRITDANPSDNVELRTIRVHKKPSDNNSDGVITPPPPDPEPDLVVSGIEFSPYPPTQGERTRVTVTVNNRGDGRADNIRIQWWAGVNYPEPAQTWTDVNLAGGASKELTFNYPGYPSWYGSLLTKAVIDPGNRIDESKENNNAFTRTIRVEKAAAAQPDLSFVGWRFTPSTPIKGQRTQIEFSIENKGEAAARNFKIEWWAGVNYPQAEKTWTGVSIRSGQRKDFSYTYADGYPSWYGQLQTKIVLDPENRTNDKDRSNNEWVKTISVRQ